MNCLVGSKSNIVKSPRGPFWINLAITAHRLSNDSLMLLSDATLAIIH